MLKIDVPLDAESYTVFIDQNITNEINNQIYNLYRYDKVFVLTQKSVSQYVDEIFRESNVKIIYLDESENIKNISCVEKTIKVLVKHKCTRKSLIIGFGGGVITDFTGFIASIYMRGIDHMFIPTTLLSMTDASIGGKTGINIDKAKNLLGTFKQPKAVFINPTFLYSLDQKHIINGFAEIIKYALIFDKDFYYKISSDFNNLIKLSSNNDIKNIIKKCCEYKRDIVVADQFEKNKRMLLNFGHTIGHAIEAYYEYKNILHGEAVYYGMSGASFISYKLNYLNEKEFHDITNFIESIKKFPLKNINSNSLISYLEYDKKRMGNKNNFILLNNIGNGIIKENIDKELIKESINFING